MPGEPTDKARSFFREPKFPEGSRAKSVIVSKCMYMKACDPSRKDRVLFMSNKPARKGCRRLVHRSGR